jgi:hypothetical protein
VRRILYEEGYRPREIHDVRLRDVLLYKQVQERRQWRRFEQMVGLRNDVRGLMGADLIELGGASPSASRDEEAIAELEDRWSDWLEEKTSDSNSSGSNSSESDSSSGSSDTP